jgi:hypothetical protein
MALTIRTKGMAVRWLLSDSHLAAGALATDAGLDVVRERPEALRQSIYGFPATPPSAIVHAVSEFIWGMSVPNDAGRGLR